MFSHKQVKKPISARVVESLRDKIDFISQSEGVTVSDVVEAWLLIGLKEYDKSKKPKKAKSQKADNFDAASFEAFYSIYPKKIAKSEAKKAWAKLKPDFETCQIIAYHLSRAYLNTEKRFIPNPSTYLNQGRWTDEVIGAKALTFGDLTMEEIMAGDMSRLSQ